MEDYYNRKTSVPWYGYRSDIQYLDIDKNITSIGEMAFYGCSSLKSVNLSENIDEIGRYAFAYCSSLNTAVINGRTIRWYAFYNCDSLTEITLNNVKNTEYGAFSNCNSLTKINISKSVSSLWLPFLDCPSLTTINVDEKSEYFLSENEILYNKNKSELILCPAKSTRNAIEIPSTVKIINKYAFQYNELVTINVEAGNKYYSSENGILYSKDKDQLVICPAKLQQNVLQIPSAVKEIGEYAFHSNTTLNEIVLPEGCVKIANNMLEKSTYLYNWNNFNTVNKYSDENGNLYLILNGILCDVKKGDNTGDFVLNLNDNYANNYGTVKVTSINLILSKNYQFITDVISNNNVTISSGTLDSTSWYNQNEFKIIYNTVNPNEATYSYLYAYTGSDVNIAIPRVTAIGKSVFKRTKDPINIHISSNTGFIDSEAFNGCTVNSIAVDGNVIDVEYLQFPKDEIIILGYNEQGSKKITASDTYSKTFKYQLAIAAANNSGYFDKLSDEYCCKILDSLNIEEYKTRGQKIKIVHNWMVKNFDYAIYYLNAVDDDSKSIPMTHSKSAHLLTGYGVCSSYTQVFNCFMKQLDIPSIYVSNGGITIDGVSGNHGWNLVEANEVNHIWYYVDVTWGWLLYGQNSVVDGGHVGYRLEDKKNNPKYLNKIFTDNKYSNETNFISDEDYEPIINKTISISKAISENLDVRLNVPDKVYNKITNTDLSRDYYLFGEKSLFNNITLTVGNNTLYTLDSADIFNLKDDITGTYNISDNYRISYLIQNVNGKINIQVWDNNAVYISFDDKANIVSHYIVKNDQSEIKYTKPSFVVPGNEFSVKFYDNDGKYITGEEGYSFLEDSNVIGEFDAIWRLSSGVESTNRTIKLETYQLGDVDLDGKLSVNDVKMLQQYLVKGYQFIQTGSSGDLLIDVNNTTINGNISANGTFTLDAENANINGTLSAGKFINNVQYNLNMNHPISDIGIDETVISDLFSDEIMMEHYFENANIKQNNVDGGYVHNSNNHTTYSNPSIINGFGEFNGNYNLQSNIKTYDNLTFTGDTVNTNDCVLYSENGDITLDTTNLTINGLVYAPNGKVTINSTNINIIGTVIAKEIEIVSNSNINFTVAAQNVLDKINITLTEFQIKVSDITKDNAVNVFDVILLKRRILAA